MVVYRCDRCGGDFAPDKLYEVELLFTPRSLDGSMNSDAQEAETLGDLCGECSDHVERLTRALVKQRDSAASEPPA
jgi:hypothetical protein